MRSAACLMLAGLTPLTAQAAPVAICPPTSDARLASPLPHVAMALKPNGKLNVLAIGSVAMQPDAPPPAPPGVAQPEAATQSQGPWQMAKALEASVRGLHVTVTVRSGHMLRANDMAAIIRADLAHGVYRLVLLQTGTVDAVQVAPPGDFYQALSEIAADVADAGADLVLVDPQYSRFLEANANLHPYLSAMQAVSEIPGVALFDRTQIMRGWAESGAIDLERTPKADRPSVAARLHMCLGRALAQALLADSALPD